MYVLNKEVKMVIALGLISIILTFFAASLYFSLFQNTFLVDIETWKRWDTLHYLNLAQNGYFQASIINRASIPYMPLYPLAIKVFSLVSNNYLLASLFISNFAYLIILIFFYKLTKIDFSKQIAWRTVVYFSIFPTSYFLHAGYSESLYIMLLIITTYFARKNKWFLTGFFGFLATFTRLNGIVLLPFLLFEYFLSIKFNIREIKSNIFWLALLPFAFVLFLLINKYSFGNPFEYMVSLKEDYWEFITVPWYAIFRAYHKFYTLGPTDWIIEGGAVVSFWIFNVFSTILLYKKVRLSYFVYTFLGLTLVSLTPTWASMPRFTLALFPIFILLAIFGKSKIVNYTIMTISLLLQSTFLILFIQGHWAF